MIDGVSAGKDYSGVIGNINFLPAEVAGRYWLKLYEGMKNKINVMLSC
jgi:hypothetical protein